MASQDKARNLRRQRKLENRRKKDKLKECKKRRTNAEAPAKDTPRRFYIPSEAILTPVVFRALTLDGNSDPEDPTQLEGRELAYWWYDSQEDRRNRVNGEQVSVLDIQRCHLLVNPKIPEHQDWRQGIPDVEYYQCEALLIEHVSKDSRYGSWLRKQAHQGNLPLDDSIEYLEKPIRFRIAIGTVTKRVLPFLKSLGQKVLQKKRCLLDMNFTDKESSALSSLQVDRIWEFYSKLVGVYPRIAGDVLHSSWQHEQLEITLKKIEERELVAAEELRARVAAVERTSSQWQTAKSKFDSTSLQANTARENLERQIREAETQLQTLQGGLEAAKQEKIELSRRVVRAHAPDSDEHHLFDELRQKAEQLNDSLRLYPEEIAAAKDALRKCQNRFTRHKTDSGYSLATQKQELASLESNFQTAAREEQRASFVFDELFAAREFLLTQLEFEKIAE